MAQFRGGFRGGSFHNFGSHGQRQMDVDNDQRPKVGTYILYCGICA